VTAVAGAYECSRDVVGSRFPLLCIPCLHESQSQRTNYTHAHGSPASDLDLFVRHHSAHIPHQVSNAVERMVCEGERKERLQTDFGKYRQASECGGHGSSIKVPAEQGRDEVEETESIEWAGEDRSRDPVQRGTIPSYLRAIDGQMGRDGPGSTLLCENLIAFLWRCDCRCRGPGRRWVSDNRFFLSVVRVVDARQWQAWEAMARLRRTCIVLFDLLR